MHRAANKEGCGLPAIQGRHCWARWARQRSNDAAPVETAEGRCNAGKERTPSTGQLGDSPCRGSTLTAPLQGLSWDPQDLPQSSCKGLSASPLHPRPTIAQSLGSSPAATCLLAEHDCIVHWHLCPAHHAPETSPHPRLASPRHDHSTLPTICCTRPDSGLWPACLHPRALRVPCSSAATPTPSQPAPSSRLTALGAAELRPGK